MKDLILHSAEVDVKVADVLGAAAVAAAALLFHVDLRRRDGVRRA